MEFSKEISLDKDSEKIANWVDFIYELVNEKKNRREFKIELILSGDGDREFEIELDEIRGLWGRIEQIGKKTLYLKGYYKIIGLNLLVKGSKIVSGRSLISCDGWVNDVVKDPYLKISIENSTNHSVNKNSFIINI